MNACAVQLVLWSSKEDVGEDAAPFPRSNAGCWVLRFSLHVSLLKGLICQQE